MDVRWRAALGTAALALLGIGSAGTAQAAPVLHCQASAGRIEAIGLPSAIEPARAGDTGTCRPASATPGLPANPVVSADALATTSYDAATRTGTAKGGLVDLKVGATPDQLSQPLEQAVQALEPVPATLNLLPVLPLGGLTSLDVLLDVRKAVMDKLAMPTGVPDTLLRIQAVTAEATVGCRDNAPSLSGSSHIAGVQLLGQDVPVDDGLHQVVTLLGAQSIPLSGLDPDEVTILDLDGAPLAGPLLDQAKDALASGITSLTGSVPIPPLSLDVTLTPGTQVHEGDTLVQRALTANVDLSGLHLLHATIGEARVAADDGACAPGSQPGSTVPAPADQGGVDAVTASGTVTDQLLACSDRRLVLVDVLRRGSRVKLLGAANRDYAGERVAIRLKATHQVVAHATVRQDGSFQTSAPLPPKRFRTPARRNLVRYSAEIGKERSLPLKLRRRMIVSRMQSKDGQVTIAGRILGPLTHPVTTVEVRRRLSCQKAVVVKRFTPHADGRFRITVPAPAGQVAAVYRMATQVRANRHNPKRFPTFTLPRGVALDTR
ncbi:MAG TPA: hypothetical protein VFT50_15990 [Baekduia sp.]|nr:hypothetical protein [Baekduia sp.]